MEKNADPNVLDTNGKTPIAISAGKGYFEITQVLLHYQADPYLCDKFGKNAIDRGKNLDLVMMMQKFKKKNRKKRSKSLILMRIFPRTSKEFWKNDGLGKNIDRRVVEKICELKNSFLAKNQALMKEFLEESIEKEKGNIREFSLRWVKMHSKGYDKELEEHYQMICRLRVPTIDLSGLFGEFSVEPFKENFRKALKQSFEKSARAEIQNLFQIAKQDIFHSISFLFKPLKSDLSYEVANFAFKTTNPKYLTL